MRIQNQGEYLRLNSQDESDNSESIYAVIATLRFGTPELEVTGNHIYTWELDQEQGRAIPVTPTMAACPPQAMRQ